MTKPIDDIALRYAIRLNTLIRDMRRDLNDQAFELTAKYVLERNGVWTGSTFAIRDVPDPRRPIRLELKQRQEQKQ